MESLQGHSSNPQYQMPQRPPRGQAGRQSNDWRQAVQTQGPGRRFHKMTIGAWPLLKESLCSPGDGGGVSNDM